MSRLLSGAIMLGMAAGSPARAEWLEAKSRHFTIYGDMSEAELRKFAPEIQHFDTAMRTLVKAEDHSPPVTIYVVDSIADVQKLAGDSSGNVAGFYNASAQAAFAIVPRNLYRSAHGSDYALDPQHVLLHEYTHHILLSNADQFYPGWASEGLAEFFMTAIFNRDGSITFGAPEMSRGFAMMGTHRYSVEQLLNSDGKRLPTDEVIERYTRGWLLVHYLLMSGKRSGQLTRYVALINQGEPADAAAQNAFGDLRKLDSELEHYLQQSSFRSAVIPADKLELKQDPLVIRKLGAGEAAMMPVHIVSTHGVTQEQAKQLVGKARAVAAQYPDDAWVQRCLAEAEYDAGNLDAADVAASRVLELDPHNVMGMIYKGRVLGRRAMESGNATQWASARSWFLKANRADPNYALPFVLYYDSFRAAGAPVRPDALQGLLRAVVLMPVDSSLRVRVAFALIEQGDFRTARRVLAPVAFDPHANGKGRGIKTIELIDKGAGKEDILAQAGADHLDGVNEFIRQEKNEPDANKPIRNGFR